MQVRVLVKRPNSGKIVPRLGRGLVSGQPSYSIGRNPDQSADINYGMCYLQGLAPKKYKTFTGAWFSHYNEKSAKSRRWRKLAKEYDICTTCADQYMELLKTQTRALVCKVTPYVDHSRFTIGKKVTKPIVGLAGYVTEGNRKGLHLVKALSNSKLSNDIDFRVVGRGWPVKHRHVTGGNMPRFFRSLQIYLCTSLIEGIPIPPLEALACGVKLVIPKGVGMLDEFGEQEGVRYFKAGNFESMSEAIKKCLDDEHDQQKLRKISNNYTLKHWQDSHRAAFRKLLKGRTYE